MVVETVFSLSPSTRLSTDPVWPSLQVCPSHVHDWIGEWSYTVGNFTYNYPKHELHFDMKATENIVAKCLVIDIDTFEQQDDLIAKSTSAFFLHENRDEHVFIRYNLRLDSEYQVVCKLYAVTRKENEEKYYSSDLLTITGTSLFPMSYSNRWECFLHPSSSEWGNRRNHVLGLQQQTWDIAYHSKHSGLLSSS